MSEEKRDLTEEEQEAAIEETGGWGVGTLLLAGVIGFGVGAAMGVLFAPRSGSETRHELLRSAQENMEKSLLTLRESLDSLHQSLNECLLSTDEIAQRLSSNGPPLRPDVEGEEEPLFGS